MIEIRVLVELPDGTQQYPPIVHPVKKKRPNCQNKQEAYDLAEICLPDYLQYVSKPSP